jgi:tRNA A37 methylthiotransferase MiaB
LSGRTFGNRIVHIDQEVDKKTGSSQFIGRTIEVKITQTLGHSLKGEIKGL